MPLFNTVGGGGQNDFEVLSGESVMYGHNSGDSPTGLKAPTTSFKKGDIVLITPKIGEISNAKFSYDVKNLSITGGYVLGLIDIDGSWTNNGPALANVYGKSQDVGYPTIMGTINFRINYRNYTESGELTIHGSNVESGFVTEIPYDAIFSYVFPVSYKIYRFKQ